MDPDAALRMIDEADRVDAETREVMRGLHQWISRGGFAPDWARYPTGARRYRKAYGGGKARSHAAKKSSDTVLKLKDRYSGSHVWLTVRDGTVVGVMGSDPKRYLGMSVDRAKHVARYGGTGEHHAAKKGRRVHATAQAAASHGTGIEIGDIVQRADIAGRNRYVVVNIQGPWIYTRRLSGRGGPGVITFPSSSMLRKVS